MKHPSNLKIVHRQQDIPAYSPEEIYQQLSEVKEDLKHIISLLDQHVDLSSLQNRRGDTGKPTSPLMVN